VRGRLKMTVTLPRDRAPLTLRFTPANGRPSEVRLMPGVRTQVDLAVCTSGLWRATFRASSFAVESGRVVSVRASAPAFSPDTSACPAWGPA
jgi:hypothetical protein